MPILHKKHHINCRCSNCKQKRSQLIAINRWSSSPDYEDQFSGDIWNWAARNKTRVNRNSREYIRWIQASLNKIMSLWLVVDGISGVKTRGAIRSFQEQKGLFVNGIVGLNTEKALIKASAILPPTMDTPTMPAGAIPLINIRIPKNGVGFITSKSNNKYGLPETIKALKAIAKSWHSHHPDIQFMIRDISRKGGGKFGNHKSHRIGLDVDVQLRIHSQKICTSNKNYPKWRAYMQELVSIIYNNPILAVKTIGFSDTEITNVSHWKGHGCHLHIRFCMPLKYQSQLNLNAVYGKEERKANYHCNSHKNRKIGINTERTYNSAAGTTTRQAKENNSIPVGPFGTLTVKLPGHHRFSYAFSSKDVLWTARFIVGEASGVDTVDNEAVIWAMFNRYALFTRKNRNYPTFHQFIRAYSTTLQPCLRSPGAAKRNLKKGDWVNCPDGSYYKGTNIRRGQRRKYIKLQNRSWNHLPSTARNLAERALKGYVPSPVGLATEFANTRIYFRHRHKGKLSILKWRQFTKRHANRKKWAWIGSTRRLSEQRQMKKNAFFLDNRVKNLPPSTVQVIRSGV